MNKQQSFEIIQQVCQKFIGTIEQHNTIGQALKTIQIELFPEPKDEKKEK